MYVYKEIWNEDRLLKWKRGKETGHVEGKMKGWSL